MSAAHTPGPWVMEVWHEGLSRQVYIRAKSFGCVAVIESDPSLPHWDAAPQRANARLIAAAPDLIAVARATLAMCERVINQEGGVLGGIDFHALHTSTSVAIAKATGEPA